MECLSHGGQMAMGCGGVSEGDVRGIMLTKNAEGFALKLPIVKWWITHIGILFLVLFDIPP